jgi:hypothetical protein
MISTKTTKISRNRKSYFHIIFLMASYKLKPRNPARYVIVSDQAFRTFCEIDKQGTLVSATTNRLPVLPVLEVRPVPPADVNASSDENKEDAEQIQSPLQAFPHIAPDVETEHRPTSENPSDLFSIQNLCH